MQAAARRAPPSVKSEKAAAPRSAARLDPERSPSPAGRRDNEEEALLLRKTDGPEPDVLGGDSAVVRRALAGPSRPLAPRTRFLQGTSNTQEQGKFHHSSFLAGKPVAAAGELRVEAVDGVSRVIEGIIDGGWLDGTPQEYLAAVQAALASDVRLSEPVPQEHSEKAVRGFLAEVARRLESRDGAERH